MRAKACEQRPLVEGAAANTSCTQVSPPSLLGHGEQVCPGHLKGGQHSPPRAQASSAPAEVGSEKGVQEPSSIPVTQGVPPTCPLVFSPAQQVVGYGTDAEACWLWHPGILGQDGPDWAPCYLADLHVLPVLPGLT